jgi:hypothetical protein
VSARKYTLGLARIAGLNAIRSTGARLPQTPPSHGLPPKLVRTLANYRTYKYGPVMGSRLWHLPGYEVLSRHDLLKK